MDMEEPVKPAPGRRARKALVTRRRVLDAAETLFVRDGYAATTIAAIAEEADVAVQTVYAVFGNKRAILSELLAIRVVGDDAVPLQSREQWQAIEREPDPRRQLALLAALATQIGNRIGGLYQALAGAAGSRPRNSRAVPQTTASPVQRPTAPGQIPGPKRRAERRPARGDRHRHHVGDRQPKHSLRPHQRTRVDARPVRAMARAHADLRPAH